MKVSSIMNCDALVDLLACETLPNGLIRVRSREKSQLEFKEKLDRNTLFACIKTIAAFSNCAGGKIIFGVSDSPRMLCGVEREFDEADIQNLLMSYLYPIPDIETHEVEIFGRKIFVVTVFPARKPPTIAIKELQTQERKNKTVLLKGVIYFRRAGQTGPASGEEFAAILERRDDAVRNSILGLLERGKQLGFENVAVADFRKYGSSEENVTLWVPESAAKDLNIIDRARLVESGGDPAYQIRGSIKLTVPSSKDPRKPMLPRPAARALRAKIREIFWNDFPWSEMHLRKACEHLGFWSKANGDEIHTSIEHLTGRPIYYDSGRAAVHRFANRTPDDFVEVVGSAATKSEWRRLKQERAENSND